MPYHHKGCVPCVDSPEICSECYVSRFRHHIMEYNAFKAVSAIYGEDADKAAQERLAFAKEALTRAVMLGYEVENHPEAYAYWIKWRDE